MFFIFTIYNGDIIGYTYLCNYIQKEDIYVTIDEYTIEKSAGVISFEESCYWVTPIKKYLTSCGDVVKSYLQKQKLYEIIPDIEFIDSLLATEQDNEGFIECDGIYPPLHYKDVELMKYFEVLTYQ